MASYRSRRDTRNAGPGVHVDESTGQVVVNPVVPAVTTPVVTPTATTGSGHASGRFNAANETERKGIIEERQAAARDRKMNARLSDYEKYYEPTVQEYGAQMERDALSAFQREKAMALQGLGFSQSAGYGDSGLYQAAELALGRAATAKAGEIAGTSENFERAAFLNYMDREDTQAFQLQQMRMQYEYQMKMAEANSPGWWSGLASLVGFAASLPMGGGMSLGGYAVAQLF